MGALLQVPFCTISLLLGTSPLKGRVVQTIWSSPLVCEIRFDDFPNGMFWMLLAFFCLLHRKHTWRHTLPLPFRFSSQLVTLWLRTNTSTYYSAVDAYFSFYASYVSLIFTLFLLISQVYTTNFSLRWLFSLLQEIEKRIKITLFVRPRHVALPSSHHIRVPATTVATTSNEVWSDPMGKKNINYGSYAPQCTVVQKEDF